MAEALTRKQVIQAVWNKFKAIIGNKDISGIGDGTVTGALVGLNGKITTQLYNNENGIIINKINELCFCSMMITFGDNTLGPWGGNWYVANIADPDFRVPYEMLFPCLGINPSAGKNYALRLRLETNGNITILNDTDGYVTPYLIFANFSYRHI